MLGEQPGIVESLDLKAYAAIIRAEFEIAVQGEIIAEQGRRQALAAYRKIGQALIDAKTLCKHGEWLSWLKVNVSFSRQQADNYRQIAKLPVTGNLESDWRAWQTILGNDSSSEREQIDGEGEVPVEPSDGDIVSPDDEATADDEEDEPRDWITASSLHRLEQEAADNGDYESAIAYQEERKKLEDELAGKSPDSEPPAHNHRAQGTGVNEWYTPPAILDTARSVLGEFDLDPASSDSAQQTVCARAYFTESDDGLTREWRGRVFMNPPYSQPAITHFIKKLVAEFQSGRVTEAITLTHNYTDTEWFHVGAAAASAICFTRGRIGFLDPEGKKASPTQGQAFMYFGPNVARFAEVFSSLGFVLTKKV